MTNTNTNDELVGRIERLVREHISTTRKEVEEAVARAFASATTSAPSRAPRQVRARAQGRRAPEELAALSERLYQAVCAKPGEAMNVLSADVGASSRELHRPMALLKDGGRVRSAGSRNASRYFPMASEADASA